MNSGWLSLAREVRSLLPLNFITLLRFETAAYLYRSKQNLELETFLFARCQISQPSESVPSEPPRFGPRSRVSAGVSVWLLVCPHFHHIERVRVDAGASGAVAEEVPVGACVS